MNRLQEQELIDAMADIHRLSAALEAAERDRDWLRRNRNYEREVARMNADSANTFRAERDALREHLHDISRKFTLAEERAEAAETRAGEMHARAVGAERVADALREQVEAARSYLADPAGNPIDAINFALAALARLDQRETE